jgi:hypothetical protein
MHYPAPVNLASSLLVIRAISSKKAKNIAENRFRNWEIVLEPRCLLLRCVVYSGMKDVIAGKPERLSCLPRTIDEHEKPGQCGVRP